MAQRRENRRVPALGARRYTKDQLAYLQAPAYQSCERGSAQGGLVAIRSVAANVAAALDRDDRDGSHDG